MFAFNIEILKKSFPNDVQTKAAIELLEFVAHH